MTTAEMRARLDAMNRLYEYSEATNLWACIVAVSDMKILLNLALEALARRERGEEKSGALDICKTCGGHRRFHKIFGSPHAFTRTAPIEAVTTSDSPVADGDGG